MSEEEINSLKTEMQDGKNPRDIKFILAEEIVDRFHKDGDGQKCKESFLNRFIEPTFEECPTKIISKSPS